MNRSGSKYGNRSRANESAVSNTRKEATAPVNYTTNKGHMSNTQFSEKEKQRNFQKDLKDLEAKKKRFRKKLEELVMQSDI